MDKSIEYNKFYDYINNIISNNKLSHSYLIEVDNYEDDFNVIIDFVKMIELNCSYNDIDNNSEIVKQIDNGMFSDLYIIEPDGSFIKKNQVMSLQEEFNNKSIYGNKRIYIIKEAERFNLSSANTILKFLEEPEEDLVAILLTNNRYKIIKTILSRCQVLSIKSTVSSIVLTEEEKFLLDCIINKKVFIEYNKIIKDIIPDKNIAKEMLSNIEIYLMECINNKEKFEYNVSNDDIYNLILIIEEEIDKTIYNINYKMWLDNIFAKIMLGGNYD